MPTLDEQIFEVEKKLQPFREAAAERVREDEKARKLRALEAELQMHERRAEMTKRGAT